MHDRHFLQCMKFLLKYDIHNKVDALVLKSDEATKQTFMGKQLSEQFFFMCD